jgi:hypothetical protein
MTTLRFCTIRLLTLALMLMFETSFALSQEQAAARTVSVYGILTDNSAPIRYANVQVFAVGSEKIAKGAITDSTGKFTIDKLVFGQYVLKIRRLGYKEFKKISLFPPPHQCWICK